MRISLCDSSHARFEIAHKSICHVGWEHTPPGGIECPESPKKVIAERRCVGGVRTEARTGTEQDYLHVLLAGSARITDQRSAAPRALTTSAKAPEPRRQNGTKVGWSEARGVSCSALLGCAPPMLRTPATERSNRLLFQHLRGFNRDLGGDPLRKCNLSG